MEANGSKYAPVPGKIPGTGINLGGVEFTLPPLNLDGVRAFPALAAKHGEAKTGEDAILAAAEVLHLALVRNYPDLTVEELTRLLDTGNLQKALVALYAVSGLDLAQPGEIRPAPQ